MPLNIIQLVDIIERSLEHASATSKDQRRSRFARIREEDASWIDAEVQYGAHFFHRGAVEACAEGGEVSEEGCVDVAFNRYIG